MVLVPSASILVAYLTVASFVDVRKMKNVTLKVLGWILVIVILLAVIFAGDTSAYYVGSYLGRHKLSPAISPGKTIEGSIGGLAANLVLGGVGKYFFLSGLPWGLSLLFFLAVGIAGQVGDLFESGLKRSSGIKAIGLVSSV